MKLPRIFSTSKASGPVGPLQLLVLQGTPFCNLDCDYCYLPSRDDRQQMPLSIIEQSIDRVLESGLVDKEFTVVWHAGEPLVLGVDYYERAIAAIATKLPPDITVHHSIQTNAVLINQDWCEFFKRHRVRLGVSIDGPAALHDQHRKDRKGKGSHHQASEGLDLLKKNHIPFHIIAVLTASTIEQPDEIFNYFSKLGVEQLCFNTEEVEGVHRQSSLLASDRRLAYQAFFRRLHTLRIETASRLQLREVDGPMVSIMSWQKTGRADNFRSQESKAFSILNVAANGDFSTWSPELLGVSDDQYGSFVLGNIASESLAEVRASRHYLQLAAAIDKGVERCQQSCDYFDFCGGGSPSNKLAETQSLSSSETAFCRLHKKTCIDNALEIMESDLAVETVAQ